MRSRKLMTTVNGTCGGDNVAQAFRRILHKECGACAKSVQHYPSSTASIVKTASTGSASAAGTRTGQAAGRCAELGEQEAGQDLGLGGDGVDQRTIAWA